MYGIFTWGPIVSAGGLSEFQSMKVNEWLKAKGNPKVEEQTVNVLLASDGQRIFITMILRCTQTK